MRFAVDISPGRSTEPRLPTPSLSSWVDEVAKPTSPPKCSTSDHRQGWSRLVARVRPTQPQPPIGPRAHTTWTAEPVAPPPAHRSLAGRRGSSRHRRLIRRSRLDRQSRVIGPRSIDVCAKHLVAVPRSITMSAAVRLELRRCNGPTRSMSRFAESSVVSAAWVRTVLGRRPSSCAPLRSSAPCASPPTSAWGSRSSTACTRP
jgi:hypothetical protein